MSRLDNRRFPNLLIIILSLCLNAETGPLACFMISGLMPNQSLPGLK